MNYSQTITGKRSKMADGNASYAAGAQMETAHSKRG